MEMSQSLFMKNQDFFISTDSEAWLKRVFEAPVRADGWFFMLCVAGECTFHINGTAHKVKASDMVCLLPKALFQLIQCSEDCRLFAMGFHNRIISTTSFITSSMTHLGVLAQNPVVHLRPEWQELYVDHFKLLEKTAHMTDFHLIPEVANHMMLSILQGLIHIHQSTSDELTLPSGRSEQIIRELIQLIMLHYTETRSVTFYAKQMNLTPQHLSTTVTRVTGRTVTDIIARIVVNDAQNKLKSTHMSIQDIAASLNFQDLSFFGKYFKRYTGMSPKHYREKEGK
jgi:AraC-like DNA-binding protein